MASGGHGKFVGVGCITLVCGLCGSSCTKYTVDASLAAEGEAQSAGGTGAGVGGAAGATADAGAAGASASPTPKTLAWRFDDVADWQGMKTHGLKPEDPVPEARWVRLNEGGAEIGAIELKGLGGLISEAMLMDGNALVLRVRARAAEEASVKPFAAIHSKSWMDAGTLVLSAEWTDLELDPTMPAYAEEDFVLSEIDRVGIFNMAESVWYVDAIWVQPRTLDFTSKGSEKAWSVTDGEVVPQRATQDPAPDSGALEVNGQGTLEYVFAAPQVLSELSATARVRRAGTGQAALELGAVDAKGREIWSESVALADEWGGVTLAFRAPARSYASGFDADQITKLVIRSSGHVLVERIEYDLY